MPAARRGERPFGEINHAMHYRRVQRRGRRNVLVSAAANLRRLCTLALALG
jgi:hypothetical protein